MNWIDYTIFIVLFFAAILGLANGPVIQFLRIGCLLTSFFTAIFFHSILSNMLKSIFTILTANLLSYFIIFGVAFIITYILTDIVKRLIGQWSMGFGLRLFGALLGILKGLVFCGVIIFGVLLFCSKPTCDKVKASKTATQIGRGMQTIASIIPESVVNKIKGYAGKIEGNKKLNDEKQPKEQEFKSSL